VATSSSPCFGPFPALVLAALAALALLAIGCVPSDWTVAAVSNASVDVIVRVTYDGGSRDVFARANAVEIVVSLAGPRPPATVSVLDPNSCAVLASGDLPTAFPVVTFNDDATAGKIVLNVQSHDVGAMGGTALSPEDNRCSGR
jgi:hypothetical protein